MAKKKTTKKTAAKKTAAKKTAAKKVSKLSQAHGKKDTLKASTLEQIWGDDGTSKYGTLDEGEYLEHLNDLSRVDLQAHAVKIGLIPIDNAEQLKKRLLVEFKKHTSQYKLPEIDSKLNKKLPRAAMKILEEGK